MASIRRGTAPLLLPSRPPHEPAAAEAEALVLVRQHGHGALLKAVQRVYDCHDRAETLAGLMAMDVLVAVERLLAGAGRAGSLHH